MRQPSQGCIDLNSLCIDPVVLRVGAHKPYVYDAGVVMDLHHQAVLVTLDIKDYPVAGENIRSRIAILDVAWFFPICVIGLVIPGFQRLFCVPVLYPELLQCFPADNSHTHSNYIPYWENVNNIPFRDTRLSATHSLV